MLTMLRRELKINFKSMCIWAVIMSLIFLVVIIVYPTVFSGGDINIDDLMDMFPNELKQLFNMDVYSMTTAFGWIRTEGHVFWLLLGGVYASMLGGVIITKEENDKTIEFLFSLPISRNKILVSKLLTGFIYIFILNFIVYLFCLIGLAATNGGASYSVLFVMFLGPVLLHSMLFSISFAISTFFNKTKKTRNIGLALTFVAYFLQILGSLSSNIEFLKKISLFEFVSIRNVTEDNLSYEPVYIIVGFLIIGIFIGLSFFQYNRKELV